MRIMELERTANDCRKVVLKMIHEAQSSHIGSNFSCIEIMTALYDQVMVLKKDEFILSKGWAVATLNYFLVKKKILPRAAITTFCHPGSKYIGLAEKMPGIPFAGGSVGMGPSAGFGRALAKKILKEPGRVFVLESDGGLDVGHVWETMLLAAHHKLDNLTLIIDDNAFQAMGLKEEILSIKDMDKTFRTRGWEVETVDGHDFGALIKALEHPQNAPRCIFAKTIKGKGSKLFEGDNLWHYWNVNKDVYKTVTEELCR